MHIQDIFIKRFRHLTNVRLGPYKMPPDSSDVIVFAGPNGGGKSSVLELIGYALSNSWSIAWGLNRTFPDFSFEVRLALTPAEVSLVRASLREDSSQFAYYNEGAKSYFDSRSDYPRGYNYPEGEYATDQQLFDSVHQIVSFVLRNKHTRSLGFFLKADRSYPQQGFMRDKLFNYEYTKTRDYVWSMAFQTSQAQYQDMFEFLVQQRYHYFHKLGTHRHTEKAGVATGPEPVDPLQPYDELLQQIFPQYSFHDGEEDIPSNLFIRLPNGTVLPFNDLSSGEKEVFFILSFFLRHEVSNAIIVVDEPELHLHPELARMLVRAMQSVRPGNQIWLATHNPEIIDEAGRDKVVYISKDVTTGLATLTLGTDEATALRAVKDIFGFSGYIGIAKRMVFLEGDAASADRKVLASVFPEAGSSIRFVPASAGGDQARINAAVMAILETDLGWASFYLLRDRDYLTQEQVDKHNAHLSGRVRVLSQHEIENYLLIDDLIAEVQTDIFGKPTSALHVSTTLKRLAIDMTSVVLRDMLSYRLNLLYRPQDFSLGKVLQGQRVVDESGKWDFEKLQILESRMTTSITEANDQLSAVTSPEALKNLLKECRQLIDNSLIGDNWRKVFPGKQLLKAYAKSEDLGDEIILQNSLIKLLATQSHLLDTELRDLVERIIAGERLN